MLSDNIRKYRKNNSMSQDELAEKLGVSRQSISLWETDQTQPTIDNIVALAKVFNISTDMLLSDDTTETELSKNPLIDENTSNTPKKERKKISLTQEIIIFGAIFCVLIAVIAAILLHKNSNDRPALSDDTDDTSEATMESDNSDFAENSSDETTSTSSSDSTKEDSGNSTSGGEINSTIPSTPDSSDKSSNNTQSTSKVDTSSPSTPDSSDKSTNSTPSNSTATSTSNSSDSSNKNTNKNQSTGDVSTSAPTITTPEFDLFTYCKNFAIQIGQLKGDFCMYQQEATKYGGYENEYFSISYWADSDMVEFCLHCPLSDTLSENFYLRMRGGYNNTYEYLTSKYYRDTGESLRSARGTIDPATFYDGYPINCNSYQGSVDGQDDFMEESRVGICDLIRCLKQFVSVEKMDCSFADFDFVNF